MLHDAVVTGVTGTVLTFGASFLTELLGLPISLLAGVGMSFLVFAALIGCVIARKWIALASVRLITGYDALWTVVSLLFLILSGLEPTLLGYAFVLFQAAVVALFAVWQFGSFNISFQLKSPSWFA